MAQFRVFLIGSSHAPLIESAADDLEMLGAAMGSSRFLLASIADPDEDGVIHRVLIPTARVQMIAEVA